jgi:hypothetical protein
MTIGPANNPGPPPSSKVGLSGGFKLAVFEVTGLTVLSLSVCIFLALHGEKSDQINALFETCPTTYQMGFGALVGLLGGKAL